MTKEKMQELEGAGEDPFLHKEDMGGLIGALLSMMGVINVPVDCALYDMEGMC